MAQGRSTAFAFRKALAHWEAHLKGPFHPKTSLQLHVHKLRRAKASRTYWARHPEMQPVWPQARIKKGEKTAKQRKYEFFMKNNDDILSVQGSDLNVLAEHFDVDQSLPEKTKQEEVFQAMADTYVHGDSKWTKERIIREKKRYLDIIKNVHFVNLSCSMAGIKESIVRTWIRTDPDFAEGVRSAQVRFGERVARAMLDKAVNGDLGAQMYTLKQFGDAVNFIDPDVMGHAATAELKVDNLTVEEQETLLHLMRKAQQEGDGGDNVPVIEEDEKPLQLGREREFIEAELPDVDLENAQSEGTETSIVIEYDGD